jgi:hypothetical protein
MGEPFEEVYFNWLCAKVTDPFGRSLNDVKLLEDLHKTEFVWLISGDDNRAVDGQYLRKEFFDQSHFPVEHYFLEYTCSVLEMLIAFSRRAEFQTDDPPSEWFWIMVDNLGLRELNGTDEENLEQYNEIMDIFLWREYSDLGYGGLFPLKWSPNNQRSIEILYQFFEYLSEKENG